MALCRWLLSTMQYVSVVALTAYVPSVIVVSWFSHGQFCPSHNVLLLTPLKIKGSKYFCKMEMNVAWFSHNHTLPSHCVLLTPLNIIDCKCCCIDRIIHNWNCSCMVAISRLRLPNVRLTPLYMIKGCKYFSIGELIQYSFVVAHHIMFVDDSQHQRK